MNVTSMAGILVLILLGTNWGSIAEIDPTENATDAFPIRRDGAIHFGAPLIPGLTGDPGPAEYPSPETMAFVRAHFNRVAIEIREILDAYPNAEGRDLRVSWLEFADELLAADRFWEAGEYYRLASSFVVARWTDGRGRDTTRTEFETAWADVMAEFDDIARRVQSMGESGTRANAEFLYATAMVPMLRYEPTEDAEFPIRDAIASVGGAAYYAMRARDLLEVDLPAIPAPSRACAESLMAWYDPVVLADDDFLTYFRIRVKHFANESPVIFEHLLARNLTYGAMGQAVGTALFRVLSDWSRSPQWVDPLPVENFTRAWRGMRDDVNDANEALWYVARSHDWVDIHQNWEGVIPRMPGLEVIQYMAPFAIGLKDAIWAESGSADCIAPLSRINDFAPPEIRAK